MMLPRKIALLGIGLIVGLIAVPSLALAVDLVDAAMRAPYQDLSAFFGVGVAGMLAHYLKKWLRGEIVGDLGDYLFRDHKSATVLAVLSLFGTSASLWLSGQFAGMQPGPFLLLAFATGWACDSALNKGAST